MMIKPMILFVASLLCACIVVTTAEGGHNKIRRRAGARALEVDKLEQLETNAQNHERQLHPHPGSQSRLFGDANYIVGGTSATPGQYPWYVAFPGNVCGGTLISNDRVLTSATCIENYPPAEVRVGASDETNGQVIEVECTKVHPQYFRTASGIYNDLAVIKLLRELPAAVTPVPWNRNPQLPFENNQTVITMGFGLTENNGTPASNLQVVDLTLIGRYACQQAYTYNNMTGGDVISNGQHLCALGVGTGVCMGDSGGPLLDGGLQVGITSFTHGDCAGSLPDVFTDIGTYQAWIALQISNNMCDGLAATLAPTSRAPSAPTNAPTFPPTEQSAGGKCLFDTVTQMFTALTNNVGNILGAFDDVATGQTDELELSDIFDEDKVEYIEDHLDGSGSKDASGDHM